MASNRYKFFTFFTLLILTGYIWIFINLLSENKTHNRHTSLCLVKQTTNIPCPSCGSTRAVIKLFQGEIMESILLNPLGLIIFIVLTIAPVWIIYDLILKKQTFQRFYVHAENIITKKPIAIPLILIVLLNWIWNINKGL